MSEKKAYPLKQFYSKIFKRYDLVNLVFTFGQDKRWRKLTAREVLKNNPKNVIDICCGTGKLTFLLNSQSGGEKQIMGYDFSDAMLSVANSIKERKKNINVSFTQGSVAKIPFGNNSYDALGITFGFRNLTYNNPEEQTHIQEMVRVLKSGGRFVILESGSPSSAFIRFFFTLYLFTFLVPLGGLLTGNFKAYAYLAKSSRYFYSRKEIIDLLENNGLKFEQVKKFMFGASNLFVFINR